MPPQTLAVARRAFAFGVSAAVGGLIIGVPVLAGATPTAARPSHPDHSAEVTIWVVIDHDNTTTIRIARSEMGQGSFTALAMLVAEELECDWSCVRADYVDTQENVVRGLSWGDMSTLASLAIRGSQAYLRKAGAQARTMLIAEAAHRWGVAAVECNARNSRVHHAATDKWLRYGELAQRASRRPVPVDVTLKPAAQWRLIGTSAPRHSRQGVGSTDLHRRLRSVRPAAASPVSHPSTIGEVASQSDLGRRIFESDCTGCHLMDGEGRQTPYAALAGSAAVQDLNGVNITEVLLNGGPKDIEHARTN